MPIYRDGNSYSDTGGGIDITEAIERLVPQPRGKGRLKAPPQRSALPQSTAVVFPSSGSRSGGGIDSPLTEDAAQREYWPAANVVSSDGLFTLAVQPYKRRVFYDVLGGKVAFEYPAPP